MAGLQALRKRLRSIRSTEQLAAAMRTAATAKYSRVNHVRAEYAPYADACRDMLSLLGDAGIARNAAPCDRRAYILLSSNRGLCGGFHAELFRFFADILSKDTASPLLLTGGRKAASYLRERCLESETFPVSDIPTFEEARALSGRVRALYASGAVSEVYIVYQSFRNVLVQTPAMMRLLPGSGAEGSPERDELLILPDRDTVCEQLAISCLDAQLYSVLLENASGAQAATLMAMRSACDNAAETAAKLETTINRQRQAQVTASVIETASGNLQQGE